MLTFIYKYEPAMKIDSTLIGSSQASVTIFISMAVNTVVQLPLVYQTLTKECRNKQRRKSVYITFGGQILRKFPTFFVMGTEGP